MGWATGDGLKDRAAVRPNAEDLRLPNQKFRQIRDLEALISGVLAAAFRRAGARVTWGSDALAAAKGAPPFSTRIGEVCAFSGVWTCCGRDAHLCGPARIRDAFRGRFARVLHDSRRGNQRTLFAPIPHRTCRVCAFGRLSVCGQTAVRPPFGREFRRKIAARIAESKQSEHSPGRISFARRPNLVPNAQCTCWRRRSSAFSSSICGRF